MFLAKNEIYFDHFFLLMKLELLAESAGHFADGSVDYGLLDTLRYDDSGRKLRSAAPTPSP